MSSSLRSCRTGHHSVRFSFVFRTCGPEMRWPGSITGFNSHPSTSYHWCISVSALVWAGSPPTVLCYRTALRGGDRPEASRWRPRPPGPSQHQSRSTPETLAPAAPDTQREWERHTVESDAPSHPAVIYHVNNNESSFILKHHHLHQSSLCGPTCWFCVVLMYFKAQLRDSAESHECNRSFNTDKISDMKLETFVRYHRP